jgi:hypothetical protein
MDIKEGWVCQDIGRIYLAHDMVQRLAVVNAVMNNPVL